MRLHRRHTGFILVLLLIAGSIAVLYWFGNWAPAYKPLLPPVYVILIGVAVWYSARWMQPRTKHDRREGDRRQEKRRG
jgi:membrane protein implicated in regulation of membrane protease activity